MNFDAFGHLTPYAVLETSLDAFVAVFVAGFPESTTRQRIFERYLEYVEELRSIVGGGFVQWVAGSFVTRKVNPGDIDVVTLLDAERFFANLRAFKNFERTWHRPEGLTDGYFLPVYPPGHRLRFQTEFDSMDWRERFGHDLNQRKKGIVQLSF